MGALARRQPGYLNRRSAACRDAGDRTRKLAEKDRSIGTPGGSVHAGDARHDLHQTIIEIDAFEFTFCKETNRAAVRRPERSTRAIRSCQSRCGRGPKST